MPHCEHLTLYKCLACRQPFCIDCDCAIAQIGTVSDVEELDRMCKPCGERRARLENRISAHAKSPPAPIFGLPTDIKAAALFMMMEGLTSEQIAVGLIQAKRRQLGGDIGGAVKLARETLMDAVHEIDAMVARVDRKSSGELES